MIRNCTGDDAALIGVDGEACRCGRTFSDMWRSRVWPHATIIVQHRERDTAESLTWQDGDDGRTVTWQAPASAPDQ